MYSSPKKIYISLITFQSRLSCSSETTEVKMRKNHLLLLASLYYACWSGLTTCYNTGVLVYGTTGLDMLRYFGQETVIAVRKDMGIFSMSLADSHRVYDTEGQNRRHLRCSYGGRQIVNILLTFAGPQERNHHCCRSAQCSGIRDGSNARYLRHQRYCIDSIHLQQQKLQS